MTLAAGARDGEALGGHVAAQTVLAERVQTGQNLRQTQAERSYIARGMDRHTDRAASAADTGGAVIHSARDGQTCRQRIHVAARREEAASAPHKADDGTRGGMTAHEAG